MAREVAVSARRVEVIGTAPAGGGCDCAAAAAAVVVDDDDIVVDVRSLFGCVKGGGY